MLPYNVTIGIIIGTISVSVMVAAVRYKGLLRADKIIFYLLLSTLINEIVADYASRKFHNNMPVYGFYNPIQLFLIASYFNYSINSLKRKNVGLLIGGLGLVFGYLDYFIIQNPAKMNNLFLLCESIIVNALCLYSFYQLLLENDDLNLIALPHFWITCIFLFFWLSTFLIWGLYELMIGRLGISPDVLHSVLLTVNVINYLGFAIVFLLYKKMSTSHGQ